MGMEFEVENAEEMCDLMCNNQVPKKGDTMAEVTKLLNRAKRSPKGRYYVYESFKRELEGMSLSAEDYQNACIDLTRILRI